MFKVLDPNVLALLNTTARCDVEVYDDTGALMDPYALSVTMLDLGGNQIVNAIWPVVPPVTTRLVRDSLGKFHIDIGSLSPNTETNKICEYMLDWSSQRLISSGQFHMYQKLKVISIRAASFLPEFRLMLDKAHKIIDFTHDCYLGYTESQLYSYLEGGLSTINAYQPTVMWSIDNYPMEQRQILLDAGLITGAMSQQLFAIDSDIPNYSDQGTAFVISHQPQLASFLNQVTQRLDKLIPLMKLAYINSGSIVTQIGPNYRLNQLLGSAPQGALFRNCFLSGQ